MELAFVEEQEARRARREAKSGIKHSMEAESSADGAKRAKLEISTGAAMITSDMDVTSIPVERVVDIVMATLGGVSLDNLHWAFDVSNTAVFA